MNFLEDFLAILNGRDRLRQLILVNVAVWLVLIVTQVLFNLVSFGRGGILFDDFLTWFEIGTSPWHLFTHPWTPLTYQFLHVSFWHILFNMLWLYSFGQFVQMTLGAHRIVPIYLIGGVAGFVAYFAAAHLLPSVFASTVSGYALGASASVMAIVVAAAVAAPTMPMSIFGVFSVELRYVAALALLFDILGASQGENTGGHVAHIGGALSGYFFVTQLREGRDWSVTINEWLDKGKAFFADVFARLRNSAPASSPRANTPPNTVTQKDPFARPNAPSQARVDAILDKIRQQGYDNLTSEEREILFKARG